MSEKQIIPPPVEPDWQGQYGYLSQAENDAYPRALADTRDHTEHNKDRLAIDPGHHAIQSRAFKGEDHHQDASSNMASFSPHRNGPSLALFGPSSTTPKQSTDMRSQSSISEPLTYSKISEANSLYYRAQGGQMSGTEPSQSDKDDKEQTMSQEADYEVDDEDIDDGEGDGQSNPQSVAERLAARRKMKRFRLTHQQTRFLMSEFAKQPHPDAAHRERLSREIPGLSPRQVQVWFQNRRAKIKRLTADDRDRMVRMRAVPDDFDNVQALHSPYGAVHGVAPVLSPSNLGPVVSSYGSHNNRPLMLDMRRAGGESYLSPTGLSQSFGGIDLGQPVSMGNSELPSPANTLYQDRFAPGSSSPSNPNLGFRSPGPYWPSTTSSMESTPQSSRPGLRGGHPNSMAGRDWSPRNAPEAVHTPIGIYQGGNSTTSSTDRQVGYPSNHFGSAPSGFSMESQAYPGNPDLPGRGQSNATDMEESAQHRIRSPTATTTGPVEIDFGFRDSYRAVGLASAPTQLHERAPALPPLRANVSSSPANHPRGPVSAPLDMPQDRSFQVQGEKAGEYSAAQLSAPISAPSDFNFHRTFPSPTQNRSANSGPLKDLFGHGVL
ncbi:hypothetical protein QQS21_004049 [Conoideocrella luteorostrata]|uniref:Homeobox domain-containing protein n=1 Tax=Conoideocrella luteorostrata TaxID=1105319 RepID=A0AAJ0CS50_9HYPO|nr:hypothetical protein QQS21_004049 [Conoideocrella luteorostrata]